MTFRSGFVAVLGRPNVGKSTLVNAFVGEKVAIVSDKPQTTRNQIRGIRSTDDSQIVFTDTPGFHKPKTLLGKRLNDLVGASVAGVDTIVQVVDAHAGVGRGDAFVYARQVESHAGTKVCAVNKVDRLAHHEVVPQLAAAGALGAFDEIVPVSAATGTGVPELIEVLLASLGEGPAFYPAGEATDQRLEDRVGELIREQALRRTREEVPHSLAVVVEDLEREGELTRIFATVVVERDSQKGIVIGKGGEMLKQIGTAARGQIEQLLGTKVFLDLRVKVLKDWQRDPKHLQRLGL
ncbi:MAG: GTPase Era [Actinomycetota bacterium]